MYGKENFVNYIEFNKKEIQYIAKYWIELSEFFIQIFGKKNTNTNIDIYNNSFYQNVSNTFSLKIIDPFDNNHNMASNISGS